VEDFSDAGYHVCVLPQADVCVDDPVGVEGDPRAVNLAGEKFDILAIGALPFLSIKPKSSNQSNDHPFLMLYGTVGRSESCENTYTGEISLTGTWITEKAALHELGVRAVQDVNESKQLEIRFDGAWLPAGDTKARNSVTATSEKNVIVRVNGLTIEVDIARGHNTSYLNLKIGGASDLAKVYYVGGILGYDDHSLAATMSDDCKEYRLVPQFISFASADA
jgi:hypothetical protein